MRKPKVPADVAAVLRQNRAAALEVSGRAGRGRLLDLLGRAQRDLERRVSVVDHRWNHGPGAGTFPP